MAPNGKSRMGGRKTGSSATVSHTALRESRPIPYTQTPPPDPPSIRKNRPVDLQVRWNPAEETETITITQDDVQTALAAYGYTQVNYYYTLNYVHVWADPSLESADLSMTDTRSGVSTTDNGAINRRARVGMHYPKVLQTPHKVGDNEDIVRLTTSIGYVSSTEVRFGVTIWNSTPSS